MPINLNDYAHSAAQRGWGSGWPACGSVANGGLAIVRGPRSGVGVSVHRRIARLVGMLLAETERRGYLMRAGQCGGYACRRIAGTNVASNHSWALALDINSLANPYVSPRRTDHPSWMPPLWNRYGFAWGGNYNNDGRSGPADSMHYEFMGSPADADAVTALALMEIGGGAPPVPVAPDTAGKVEPVAAIPINPGADGTFRSTVMAETGDVSIVVARSFITIGSTWGGSTFTVTAIDRLARVMLQRGFTIGSNGSAYLELPNGCALATVEGKANPGAIPAAALIVKPK